MKSKYGAKTGQRFSRKLRVISHKIAAPIHQCRSSLPSEAPAGCDRKWRATFPLAPAWFAGERAGVRRPGDLLKGRAVSRKAAAQLRHLPAVRPRLLRPPAPTKTPAPPRPLRSTRHNVFRQADHTRRNLDHFILEADNFDWKVDNPRRNVAQSDPKVVHFDRKADNFTRRVVQVRQKADNFS